jgi:hypothetical protein
MERSIGIFAETLSCSSCLLEFSASIPLGNLLPATAVVILALSLVQHDGSSPFPAISRGTERHGAHLERKWLRAPGRA